MTKAKSKTKAEEPKEDEDTRFENRAEVAKNLRSLANRIEGKGGENMCLFFGYGDGETIEGGVFCANDNAHTLLGIMEYTKSNLVSDMIANARQKTLMSQLNDLVETVKASKGGKH